MIRRHHPKDSCTGKLRYPTIEQAEMEIARAKTYRNETLRAYECNRCGNFHLTSEFTRDYQRRSQ